MCEATGFRFEAFNADGKPAVIMGDEVKPADRPKLSSQLPLARQTRLLSNGIQAAESAGNDRAEFGVTEPRVYRLDAWLTVDGEPRPWIFANPIHVLRTSHPLTLRLVFCLSPLRAQSKVHPWPELNSSSVYRSY